MSHMYKKRFKSNSKELTNDQKANHWNSTFCFRIICRMDNDFIAINRNQSSHFRRLQVLIFSRFLMVRILPVGISNLIVANGM